MDSSNPKIHKLLKRQFEKKGIDFSSMPDEVLSVLYSINEAYFEFDADREMLQRSLNLSSHELLQTNSELSVALEAFPDQIFRIDHKGVIMQHRGGIAGEYAFSTQDILGKKIQDCSEGKIGKLYSDAIKIVTESESMASFEYSLIVNNSEQSYEARLLPLLESQIMVIIRNVNDRKLVERSLEKGIMRLSKKSRHEAIVSAITRVIHQTLNLETVLKNAVGAIRENIDMADSVAVYIVEGKNAVLKAQSGFLPTYLESAARIEYPQGLTWKTISGGRESYNPDVDENSVMIPDGEKVGSKSFLSIPIKYLSNPVGTLNLYSNTKNAFDEEELSLFAIVTQQLEVAFNNARQAEAFKRSEERYRTLFDQSPLGVCIIDPDLRISNCNEAMVQICQSTFESIIGLDLNTLKDQSFVPAVKKSMEGEVVRVDTFYEVTTSGAKLWLSTRLAPLKDGEGNVIGVFGVITDVTDKKTAEEKVRESEEKYRTLIENSTDAILETTTEGDMLYISPNVFEHLGYTPEELIGSKIFDLVHPDEKEKALAEHKIISEKFAPSHTEYRYRHKNGRWRYIESSGRPVQTAADQTRVIITARDVTEKKSMEEAILKAQKIDSLSVLAAGIAHDFNNLLTGILGNVFLLKKYRSDLKEFAPRYDASVKAVSRASDLTTQLLTFAKGGDPVRKTAAISQILVDSANFALMGSNVKCAFSLNDSILPVEVDVGHISQVINNLVINAKQAMPAGGNINIGTENVRLADENSMSLRPGDYVKFWVQDSGVGIAKKNLPKIFDPYFTTKKNSSGLGLSTALSIINAHDGLITAESKPRRGTTFYIYLPASRKTYVEPEKHGPIAEQRTGNILIMDDEAIITDTLSVILANYGFNVDIAERGEEAIEKYKEALANDESYDLIILDLTIPGGMGGKETMENLLKIDPNVRAIVSSGYSNDPVLSDFSSYGFKGSVNKPYGFEELIQVLNTVLS